MAVSGQRRRLRIDRAVDATVFTLKNIPALLRLGLIPGGIALAIGFAMAMAMPVQAIDFQNPAEAQRIMNNVRQLFLIPSGLFVVAGAILAVGIHRLIVRGERPGWVIIRFGRYELAFSTAVAIMFAAFSSVGLLDILSFHEGVNTLLKRIGVPADNPTVPWLIAAALVIILLWLCLRLVLMPSHAALTGRLSPSVSWRAMAWNVWRAIIGLFAVGIGAGIAAFIGALPGLLFTEVLFPPPQIAIADNRDMLLVLLYRATAELLAYGGVIAVYAAFFAYLYKDLVAELPPVT